MDIAIVVIYLVAMLVVGYLGKLRATNQSEYLVAGRRLGPLMYAGTLSALVLGGASTIGGVGLGYEYGLSGMWLVVAIGCGVGLLSLAFAGRIQRVRVFTVSQMLALRYGPGTTTVSAVVQWGYTLVLSATSTIAYGTIFGVLFGMDRVPAILIGGAVVVAYTMLGGMWSVTLTDIVQFVIQTVGILLVLLPIALWRAGGVSGITERLGERAFEVTAIGGGTIVTYFVVYFFGILIGQDIWQRVFTARSPAVARGAGLITAAYCVVYGVAGALIGTAAAALIPGLESRDDAFVEIVQRILPVGVSGLVLAAALAAVMSTASGALIATATVARQDIITPMLRAVRGRTADASAVAGDAGPSGTDAPAQAATRTDDESDEVSGDRRWVLVFGVAVIVIAIVVQDVVAALTIAYDILVGGLLVPVLGGLLWRRATAPGALASTVVGTAGTLVTMEVVGDIYANEPIYVGLGGGLLVFVVVSLATRRTAQGVLAAWDERIGGEKPAEAAPESAPEAAQRP